MEDLISETMSAQALSLIVILLMMGPAWLQLTVVVISIIIEDLSLG